MRFCVQTVPSTSARRMCGNSNSYCNGLACVSTCVVRVRSGEVAVSTPQKDFARPSTPTHTYTCVYVLLILYVHAQMHAPWIFVCVCVCRNEGDVFGAQLKPKRIILVGFAHLHQESYMRYMRTFEKDARVQAHTLTYII